ncbi:membrane protein insertase YidC [bacterium]|nr:membrane protein insertase YidC [bacterium]
MDRRTVLAMVLFLGIFLTWTKVMERNYTPEPGAADSLAAAGAIETVEPAAPVRDERERPARTPDMDPLEQTSTTPAANTPLTFPNPGGGVSYEISTDLYTITLSAVGGTITSWRGHEYPGPADGLVELVPERGEFDPPREADVLMFERGGLDLGEVFFQPVGPRVLRLGAEDAPREMILRAESTEGLVVEKIFTATPGIYALGVRYTVLAESDEARAVVADVLGHPQSARFRWNQGIAVTEEHVEAMMRSGAGGRSFGMVGEELQFRKQGDLGKDNGKGSGAFRGSVRFAGVQSKYFVILGFLPDALETVTEGRIRLGGDSETGQQSWELELPLRGDTRRSGAGLSMYMGPNDYYRFRSYGISLEQVVNLGWKWIQPISELVLKLMNWLHKFIPNYGWVIVIISILSKLVFYPLTARGTRAMKKMQDSQARLKPKLDAIKKKWSGDAQRVNQETMKLYKEQGVNPMAGMAGCLPMLIQMPVFLALYQVLYNMVDLRMAPWMLWIDDLSQPDALFTLPFSLPLVGSYFNLLPLIMAVSTYLQTKLTPQSGAGGQMAAMTTIMPFMMLFFLYNMPSGLVIYWTINTAMTAFQSWQVNRSTPAVGGAEA